ncbi:hypothetical protein NBRC116598_00730 [Pseudophaeobacter arcticus]|uniref:Uncharacterized protein n=1 Tax=Pseudophaeobacter arcticus TaxID=385492 RepID=A0ABQ0AFH5_9RHOB
MQITGVQDVTDLRSHRAPVHGLNDFGIGERKQQVLHIGGTFAAARHMNDQRMHGLHLPQKGALEKRSDCQAGLRVDAPGGGEWRGGPCKQKGPGAVLRGLS